jgi:peptidoglycan/xylan/chitin deacetylase (PgdA/CDA1 family)
MKTIFALLAFSSLFAACNSVPNINLKAVNGKGSLSKTVSAPASAVPAVKNQIASPTEIIAKRQVPVLCYHHIREPKPGQSETLKNYSVSPSQFREQMKALKDSGYETILPDQLYNYLAFGGPLPVKPVMITFDDTDEEQFTIGAAEMKKYGFKGVFFIMTISINRPRYMTKEQIKQLAEEGHAVESHTWDHHMVTKYQGEDWQKQLIQPMKKVEEITGKSAQYFAYPFGLWNKAAFPELKKAGYKLAFTLSGKRDSTEPLYTIRRMLVPGQWSTNGMMKSMKRTFALNN